MRTAKTIQKYFRRDRRRRRGRGRRRRRRCRRRRNFFDFVNLVLHGGVALAKQAFNVALNASLLDGRNLIKERSRRPSIGSNDRAIDRSDRSIRSIRYDFRFFGNVGELEICLMSKFQLCTTLEGRKKVEKPKRFFLDFLSSSVRSVR